MGDGSGSGNADFVFDGTWDGDVAKQLDALVLGEGGLPEPDAPPRIRFTGWEGVGALLQHAEQARRWGRAWQQMSRWLVGRGVRQVSIAVPLDDRFLVTPGLLGCPERPGEPGDAHWRFSSSPVPAASP